MLNLSLEKRETAPPAGPASAVTSEGRADCRPGRAERKGEGTDHGARGGHPHEDEVPQAAHAAPDGVVGRQDPRHVVQHAQREQQRLHELLKHTRTSKRQAGQGHFARPPDRSVYVYVVCQTKLPCVRVAERLAERCRRMTCSAEPEQTPQTGLPGLNP